MNKKDLEDNIKLCPFTIGKSIIFFDLINKNRKYLKKRLGWLDHTKTVEDTKNFIEKSITSDNKGYTANFFIEYNNNIIGTISLRDIKNREAIVGYWIDENFQRKGIVTYSLKYLINNFIKKKNINKLIIRCSPDNIASSIIAKKCNFKYIKNLKNAENLYGILNDLNIYELYIW